MNWQRLRMVSALAAGALLLASAASAADPPQKPGKGATERPEKAEKAAPAAPATGTAKAQPKPKPKAKPSRGACGGTQVFSQWGDKHHYALMANGGFEKGRRSWSARGGARVVAGNETFFARSRGDRYSLSLPAGSSATLHAKCVRMLFPIVRFFVMNAGDPAAKLRLTVTYIRKGKKTTALLGEVTGRPEWAPSPMLTFLNRAAALHTQANGQVWVTFAPVGAGGDFRIDDVYIDPLKLI